MTAAIRAAKSGYTGILSLASLGGGRDPRCRTYRIKVEREQQRKRGWKHCNVETEHLLQSLARDLITTTQQIGAMCRQ